MQERTFKALFVFFWVISKLCKRIHAGWDFLFLLGIFPTLEQSYRQGMAITLDKLFNYVPTSRNLTIPAWCENYTHSSFAIKLGEKVLKVFIHYLNNGKKVPIWDQGCRWPLAISHPPETYLTTFILFNSRVIGKQKAKSHKRK